MSDEIRLTGLEVFAHHGVLPEEREQGQLFYVDVALTLDLSLAGQSDDLRHTVHYGELAEAIRTRVAGERWDLIERVADRVAEMVLEDTRVESVTVVVHKPSAPIPIPFRDVSVTIQRSR